MKRAALSYDLIHKFNIDFFKKATLDKNNAQLIVLQQNKPLILFADIQVKDQSKAVQKPTFFKTTHILSQLRGLPCGQLLRIDKK